MAKVGFCHMLLRLRHVGFAPPIQTLALHAHASQNGRNAYHAFNDR